MSDKPLKTIVLMAHIFPFNSGVVSAESYLETEIGELARYAERVIVFTHENIPGQWPLLEGLPENVSAFAIPNWFYVADVSLPNQRLQRLSYLIPPRQEIRSDRHKISSRAQRYVATTFLQQAEYLYANVLRILREEGIELSGEDTLLYSFWFNEPAWVLIKLASQIERKTGTRPLLISRAHGYDCYDERSQEGYLPFKAWMARRLDAVFVCSGNGVGYLAERQPEVAERFCLGHLGTPEVQVQERRVPDGNRGEGEVQSDRYSIVCCSRAVAIKRVDRVLDALQILEDRGYELCWTYIGDGETMPLLREKAQALRTTTVSFLGNLSYKNVMEYYAHEYTDLFINVSESEGIPLSIMEALSYGIPAIATDVGGNTEIVLDGINGSIIQKDFSNEQLADAIEAHINKPQDEVLHMRAQARRVWEEKFCVKTNIKALMAKLLPS
ncbi:MAG: glycosyltransferase [Coriobacteriales bacterium]|jgi:glycosyltransferase involved in cell wall biosynthesis|nr:glycosyltransferase [Coriobacteriales bacterium]